MKKIISSFNLFCRKQLFIYLSILLSIAVVGRLEAQMQEVPFTAVYTFIGQTGHVGSFNYNGSSYDGISMDPITKVGVTSSSSPENFRADTWSTGGIDVNKYIGFTITANSGYKFTVNTITFGI
ncbi:MAG: hypothetical protein LBS50_11765, partial [Prevotellaceae bacterium]|nr:hypothetical protein [Prevotellaceae bacterium]